MRYSISPDAAFAAVEDGAVVLHMRTKRYFSLNETGTFVWRQLEERVTRSEIVRRLVEIYEVGMTEAELALSHLIDDLLSEELVQREAT